MDPPPLLGEHTREILGSLIGLDEAEIARLIINNVVSMPKSSAGGPRDDKGTLSNA